VFIKLSVNLSDATSLIESSMTSLLSCSVAAACACNVLHVAGLHLQAGPALGNSAGVLPWHGQPDTTLTPEDMFNQFLETHEDPVDNAPSGAAGTMATPSGNYGPILVVYLTYNGATAVKTLAQVQGLFWNSPGLKEAYLESSWGQVDLQTTDVDFLTMESPVDPATFNGNLNAIYYAINPSATYQTQYATRSYTNTMVIYPGTTFSASAYTPGTWSQYQGDSITWQTFFHELGHNWGLHHAGGYQSDGSYEQYLDDAIMGYQRSSRHSDPNAVTRYRLGWLTGAEVKQFQRGDDYQVTDLSPLNLGPTGPGFMMVKISCDECVGQMASVAGQGALYLSFRVDDTGSTYGVSQGNGISCYDKFLVPEASDYLVLTDRVHVHFQSNVNQKTEIWTTMAAGDTQYIAEATMWIHVCSLDSATYAKVSVSDTSQALAIAGCSAPASATGDPHLQNIHGERFDLMKPGNHVLINIPRGEPAENALLRVQADARQVGRSCSDMYFQKVNITGTWAEAKQAGGYHHVASNAAGKTAGWIAFGKVELKVVQGHTQSGVEYLNVYVKHLGQAGYLVGGLLGEDDHQDVTVPQAWCHHRTALTSGKNMQSPGFTMHSTAEASLQ